MTVTLADLFDRDLFDAMVEQGYVRVQEHPDLPLQIANYAEKAQYEHVWNPVTLACRGLIYGPGGEVVARPYRKFFNYGDERNTGPLDLTARSVVTDKLDGSLGIGYPTPDGPAIATRGSFTSDQAVHATALLRERHPDWTLPGGCTPLFEVVYPGNRIVVDYGARDDLILHGLVSLSDGYVYQESLTEADWPGPIVERFAYATLGEALEAAPRPNAEGHVVLLGDQRMVKLKQEDYVRLHRIITGLNAKTVWEWLGDGKTVGDLCAEVPDDFHGWITDVAGQLTTEAETIIETAKRAHAVTLRLLPDGFDRGDYARAVSGYHCKPYLFLLLDDNEAKARDLAWRSVKPSGIRSLINYSEAVA